MAIANLVSSSQQRSANDPAMTTSFRKSNANANLTKKSNMFGDMFITNSITSMNSLGSQLNSLYELSNKLVLAINSLIKDIKLTQKDILSKFKSFNTELNANKVDFAKSALIAAPALDLPAIEDIGAPTLVAKNDKPVPTDGPSDIMGMVKDALLGLLGGAKVFDTLKSLGLFFGTTAGLALLAFAGTSLVLYKSLEELTKAIMNDPDFKKIMERDAGKTDPELRQENVNRMSEKNNPVARAQTYKNQEEFFANNTLGDDGKPIKVGDIRGRIKDGGNEIVTLKEKLKDGTAYINITTGEKYLSADYKEGKLLTTPTPPPAAVTKPEAGASPAQMAPAAPAPVLTSTSDSDIETPAQKSQRNRQKAKPEMTGSPAKSTPSPASAAASPTASAPTPPSSSEGKPPAEPTGEAPGAGVDGAPGVTPQVDNRSWLQKTLGMPARGRNAPAAKNSEDLKPKGDGAYADQSQARDRAKLQEGMSRNPITGEKLKGTGTPALRQRARGQVIANAGRENKAGFERIQFGAGGEDYGARNQTTYGEKTIGGMKTSVPIYYNPVTDKSFSPEAVIKSSERTRPEMLRGRMEQFDRQQATAAIQAGENTRIRSSVKPLQPVVMNNSSSTNNGSVAGSEADNMSGQNFPMNANNPNLQKIIAQQNVHYQ
jgi:hypothetical protein